MRLLIACLVSSCLLGSSPSDLSRLFLAQEPAADPDQPAWRPEQASEVLLIVKGFYDGAKDLEAKFEQKYWNPTYNETRTAKGKLQAKKPGKMVWDQRDEQDSDFYTDGNTLWMVEHATRQCRELLTGGAPGIHFYTLNKARPTSAIVRNLGLA